MSITKEKLNNIDIKTYHNGCGEIFFTFTHKHTLRSVSATVRTKAYYSIYGQNKSEEREINWSCLGSGTLDEADKYAKLISFAVKYIKKYEVK